MRTAALVLAAMAAAANAGISTIHTQGGCKWTWKGPLLGGSPAATFDVSNMTLSYTSDKIAYHAHDPYNEQQNEDRYQYTFNVCGDVPSSAIPMPSVCPAVRSAVFRTMRTQSDDDFLSDAPSAEAQTDAGVEADPSTYCEPLTGPVGGRYAAQSVAYAALHDPDRPAHGFTIAYPSYSNKPEFQCKPPANAPNQSVQLVQFRHVFICEDFPTPTAAQTNAKFNQTIVLNENGPAGCYIDAYIFGHAGCPQECPVVNGKLCAGQGICDFDKHINKARCFCNDGFIEADCNSPLDPVPVGGIVGAVFGGLFLGAAVIGAYWYFRVRNGAGGSMVGGGDAADGFYAEAPDA